MPTPWTPSTDQELFKTRKEAKQLTYPVMTRGRRHGEEERLARRVDL